MRIAVTHTTRLDFGDEVTESITDTHLGPRDDRDQRVQRFNVRIEPAGHVRRYDDGFGNHAHLITSMRPHGSLQVTADSEVLTFLTDPFALPSREPEPLGPVDLADFLDPSPLVPRLDMVTEMAAPHRTHDPFESVQRLMGLIYDEFAYSPGVTDVTTSIDRVIAGQRGVCQDFAHLLVGLCRAIDVPARYVSGYVVAGHHDESSRGAGASHAWVEAFTPTHGWRGFDPTNNLVANERYVKVAIGRDYRDVPPTRGTYHGAAGERLTVSVLTRVLD